MKSKLSVPSRIILALAALAMASACEMSAGSASTPPVAAIPENGVSGSPDPDPDTIWMLTPTVAFTPKPTKTASTVPVTMTAGEDLRCGKGPDAVLYEQVADIAKGDTVALLAKAPPQWDEFYYVRKSGGAECWAFGGSSTTSGNLAALPVRDAPPLPSISLTIRNNTYLYVVDIFIRGKGETDWSPDRLAGSFIAPEGKTALSLTAGYYDMQMKDSMGGILFEKADIAIGPESPYRNTVLDYEYLKAFLNLSENYFCRVVIRPLAGEIPITVTIPDDGIISPGEKVVLKALAGFYEVRLFRCGDGALAATLNTVYIGPIPIQQTIT